MKILINNNDNHERRNRAKIKPKTSFYRALSNHQGLIVVIVSLDSYCNSTKNKPLLFAAAMATRNRTSWPLDVAYSICLNENVRDVIDDPWKSVEWISSAYTKCSGCGSTVRFKSLRFLFVHWSPKPICWKCLLIRWNRIREKINYLRYTIWRGSFVRECEQECVCRSDWQCSECDGNAIIRILFDCHR